jgi:hypothetical protein
MVNRALHPLRRKLSGLISNGLTRLSLLEGAGMRKRLKINLRLAKVCSHFPTLLLP